MSLGRMLHTVRHLRPRQVIARLGYRKVPTCDQRPAPPLRPMEGPWAQRPRGPAVLVGPDEIRIHGVQRRIAQSGDWDRKDWPHLWRYHLHYHDDIVASGHEARSDLQSRFLLRWLQENPPTPGSAWDPYPVSRRLLNWAVRQAELGDLPEPLLANAAREARWLRRRIEWHLDGNHLLCNGMALVAAGLLFSGGEGDGWLRAGLRLTDRCLTDQVLPDGGHNERSAMYQAIVLEDLLRLLAIAGRVGISLPRRWQVVSRSMAHWLQVMTHPDGGIVQFNDAAIDQALPTLDLVAWAHRLDAGPEGIPGDGLVHLTDTGFARLRAGDALLFVDLGDLGPDHQPGHGHADHLTCELSLGGRRLLVDSGISEYGVSPERLRQRGSAAHNTVVIDGRDSSEVWHGFRVARRAHVRAARAYRDGSALVAEGAHDGYRRLRGGGLHHRRYRIEAHGMIIADRVDGRGVHDLQVAFHFHPAAQIAMTGGGARAYLGDRLVDIALPAAFTWTTEASTWHPGFNRIEPNLRLTGRTRSVLPAAWEVGFRW